MSVTARASDTAWSRRPGWGIAADLTPREIVSSRQVRVHQRLIVLGLVLVLAVCVGVALLARSSRADAQREYDQAQARTGQLAASADAFASITAMGRVTTQVDAELATVMSQDAHVPGLMARIDALLPDGVTVETESVVLTAPTSPGSTGTTGTGTDPTTGTTDSSLAAAPPTSTGSSTGSTGSSTDQQAIGTVSLSGAAPSIRAVTTFLNGLSDLPWVTNLVPTSVTRGDRGADYAISLQITDQLYSGRYTEAGTR